MVKFKTNPIIISVRLIFGLTMLGSLAISIWIGAIENEAVGAYLMTAFVALLSLLVTYAPEFLARTEVIMMPVTFQAVFCIFTFCALFLGEILKFYDRFFWWDTMLHFISGVMFCLVGMMVFVSLNRNKSLRSQFNPIGIVLFAVCFSVTCGTLWEVFEFSVDSIINENMQRWRTDMSPEEWLALLNTSNQSNPGLIDTMEDIIAVILGSVASLIFIYPLIKYENRFKETRVPNSKLMSDWQKAMSSVHPFKSLSKKKAAKSKKKNSSKKD